MGVGPDSTEDEGNFIWQNKIMDYVAEVAKQGLGYLLFAGAVLVIFALYKENKQLSKDKVDLANQRVQDLKEARDSYAILSESATKVAENTYTIVQNMQSLMNTWKKS